jgi:hypothetical protein
METIIREMKGELEEESGNQASGDARAEEHARVLEAVEDGLLQTLELHLIANRQESSGCCARTPTDSITELVGIRKLRKHWTSRTI